MPDHLRRVNVHAVLLKMIAVLFGLISARGLWNFLLRPALFGRDTSALGLGIMTLPFAALFFAIAYGLWRSRRWARWLAIGVSALVVLKTAQQWLAPYEEPSVWSLVAAAVGIVVIVICVRRPEPAHERVEIRRGQRSAP